MEKELLILQNITKEFPGVRALDSVSITIKKGEIRALVGENGAGKSTLIKILSGAYRADSGEIIFDGSKSQYDDPIHALELGIGAIYQEFNLIPNLSVAENIVLGQVPKKGIRIDSIKMHQKAKEAITKLGVTLDTHEKVQNLTLAQQQIVEIAKVIVKNLRVLIMDEPTAALNEIETANLFKVIRLLKKQGVTILYISHRLKEVFNIADSVTVLKDGKEVDTKAIDDINREELVRMMIGRQIHDYYPERGSCDHDVVLAVKDLWYKNRVCGVSFDLKKGEILGVAGLEGQGQSELIRTIIGLYKLDKGSVYRDGVKVEINNPGDAKSAGIGYIPDDRKRDGLILVRSVLENITLPSIKNRKRAGVFIDFVSEKLFVNEQISKLSIKVTNTLQLANNLSGGNQQKVVVSKWLGTSPEVLIVAEPTRGIDVGSKKEIYHLLRDLAQKGVSILMSSCELPELLGMSDRILVMAGGKIVAEIPGNEATEENIMIAATKDVEKVNQGEL